MHISAKRSDYETIKLLISYGTDVNFQDSYGFTHLYYVIWSTCGTCKNSINSVYYLVNSNACLNIKNKFGKYPIDYDYEHGIKSVSYHNLEHKLCKNCFGYNCDNQKPKNN